MTATTRPAVAIEGGCVVLWETKCLLVLEPVEILGLLRHDPETWARAIKRGKFHRRGEATARRTGAPERRESDSQAPEPSANTLEPQHDAVNRGASPRQAVCRPEAGKGDDR